MKNLAVKAFACALSLSLVFESFGSVSGYAADGEEVTTVTISSEELEALATDGKYLISATDGVESAPVEAALTTEYENDGGFQSAKSPVITKKRRKLFKKALKGFVGSNITPVAYLGSQVVAGINHRYLCRIKAVVPGAQEYYCFVTVYEDPEGNASIENIVTTETETGINELMGGWFQASSAKVTKSIRKAFKKAMKGLVGVNYEPVAVLSQQVVAGMNYGILCRSQVVYPGAPSGYSLVYMFIGLDGSAKINDIKELKDTEDEADPTLDPSIPEHSMKTLIVSVSENATQKSVKKIFKKLGLSIVYDYENFNMYAVSLAEETDEAGLTELIEKLEAYDEITNVERDYIAHID